MWLINGYNVIFIFMKKRKKEILDIIDLEVKIIKLRSIIGI